MDRHRREQAVRNGGLAGHTVLHAGRGDRNHLAMDAGLAASAEVAPNETQSAPMAASVFRVAGVSAGVLPGSGVEVGVTDATRRVRMG